MPACSLRPLLLAGWQGCSLVAWVSVLCGVRGWLDQTKQAGLLVLD
jgi:hypothetical protein